MLENSRETANAIPADFLFGAGTSSYQVEGAWNEDGKGESIWDRFTHTKGRIERGETGDLACDHYHRFEEDADIMARLGIGAYRFSIAWPRILPHGRGTVNPKGLDHYERVVDALLERSIEPFITLYHWDLPSRLQDQGGWANPEVRSWFVDYAAQVIRRLGDRVRYWTTLNEPWMFVFVGHLLGWHAPGKHNPWTAFRSLHNALVSHGLCTRMIREECPGARVGISLSISPLRPATESERDRKAMQMADLFMNRLIMDPLLTGEYPRPLTRRLGLFFPRIRDGELDLIRTPLDFVGVNTYTRETIRYLWWMPLLHFWSSVGDVPETEFVRNGIQYTDMGYEVRPESLHAVLMRLKDEYGNPPVFVTENGASFTDNVDGDAVHDPLRQAYVEEYVAEALRAQSEGADLRGYFLWTLLDNFEWAYGYAKRHGIVHVDFPSGKRTIKDSGYAYGRLIERIRGKS